MLGVDTEVLEMHIGDGYQEEDEVNGLPTEEYYHDYLLDCREIVVRHHHVVFAVDQSCNYQVNVWVMSVVYLTQHSSSQLRGQNMSHDIASAL